MEKGNNYNVYYQDDSHSRKKELTFNKIEHGFLYGINNRHGLEEIIPLKNIIRIEGIRKYGEDSKSDKHK